MKKNPHTGGDVMEFLREQRAKNPELQRLYELGRPRFEQVSAMIGARAAAGLTQKELAERMGVDVRTIWRLESLEHSPRLDSLQRAAEALDCDLEVKFVPRSRARARGVAEEAPTYSTRSRPSSKKSK